MASVPIPQPAGLFSSLRDLLNWQAPGVVVTGKDRTVHQFDQATDWELGKDGALRIFRKLENSDANQLPAWTLLSLKELPVAASLLALAVVGLAGVLAGGLPQTAVPLVAGYLIAAAELGYWSFELHLAPWRASPVVARRGLTMLASSCLARA